MSVKKKILGVVQVLIGLINLTLGITMMSVSLPSDGPKPSSVYTGYTIWGSVVFIVSGALLIAEEDRDAYLISKLISLVMAIIGIVITALSLRDFSFDYPVCEDTLTSEKCAMLMDVNSNLQILKWQKRHLPVLFPENLMPATEQ
nr:membrane-spanning 4-domains subfamily A member 4A-like isoform X1 [Loxodonta africana]